MKSKNALDWTKTIEFLANFLGDQKIKKLRGKEKYNE